MMVGIIEYDEIWIEILCFVFNVLIVLNNVYFIWLKALFFQKTFKPYWSYFLLFKD